MSENIKNEKLNDAIEYQNNAIVSKQIIKKSNGNITLFAFDINESLSEHTSPYDAFVYVVEGELEITIGGYPYNLKSGDFIIMPANIPHGLKSILQSKMLLVMIK